MSGPTFFVLFDELSEPTFFALFFIGIMGAWFVIWTISLIDANRKAKKSLNKKSTVEQ